MRRFLHAGLLCALAWATTGTLTAQEAAPPAPAVPDDRARQRQVEALLSRCIGPGLSWGFYEGQFKEILALGPDVPRILLRLFTTPHAVYTFAYDFADEPAEDRVDRQKRKLIIQQLAGSALGASRDRSIVPDLLTFIGNIEKANPDLVDAGDVQQDFHATAAVALLKLGAPLYFEKLVKTLRGAAGVTLGDDGAMKVAPAPDRAGRFRQMDLLQRLGMLHMRDDNAGMAERAYRRTIDLGAAELQRLRKTPEAYGDWARLFTSLQFAHYNLACVFAQRVKTAETIRHLKKAVDYGYIDLDWIKRDRDLDVIRDDPAYAELVDYVEARIKRFREAAREELEKLKRGETPDGGKSPPPSDK